MKDFIKAGKITREAILFAKDEICEGVNVYDYVKSIEDKIYSLGAKLAFPVNVSVDSDAAHDTADYKGERVFKKGELVKVDVGAQVNGYVGDSAFTKEVKTNKYSELIKASGKALSAALKIIKPGVEIGEIGKVIEKKIKSYGFKPIKNLGGHGLDIYNLHAGLFIPNYNNHDSKRLKEGDMIAVEPFATNGKGRVVNSNRVKIHSLIVKKPVRSLSAKKLLKFIKEEFKTLPFAQHHLYDKFSESVVKLGMRELMQRGILHSYPVLREAGNGFVSQAEHTLLVKKEPIITTL